MYGRIIPGGYEFLGSLIGREEFPESEWLDYKGAKELSVAFSDHPSPLAKANRDKALSKIKETHKQYISAFSNTMGGLLIWGITADDRFPDSLSLVRDVHQFEEFLRKHTADACDPPVQGVINTKIPGPDCNSGFVVTYVPLSPARPHKSIEGHCFHQRVQDSVRPIPTAMLRSMFYPHLAPRVQLILTLSVKPVNRGARLGFGISIEIYNVGVTSLESAFCRLGFSSSVCDPPPCPDGFWQADGDGLIATRSIHPGERTMLGSKFLTKTEGHEWEICPACITKPIFLQANLYCRNSYAQHAVIEVDTDTLRTLITNQDQISRVVMFEPTASTPDESIDLWSPPE